MRGISQKKMSINNKSFKIKCSKMRKTIMRWICRTLIMYSILNKRILRKLITNRALKINRMRSNKMKSWIRPSKIKFISLRKIIKKNQISIRPRKYHRSYIMIKCNLPTSRATYSKTKSRFYSKQWTKKPKLKWLTFFQWTTTQLSKSKMKSIVLLNCPNTNPIGTSNNNLPIAI
jgi:hypothetical protein